MTAEYPIRIYKVYCRSDDNCVGTFTNLAAILEAHPEIADLPMNFRVEEVWNGKVVRMWRPELVEMIDWKII